MENLQENANSEKKEKEKVADKRSKRFPEKMLLQRRKIRKKLLIKEEKKFSGICYSREEHAGKS